MEVTELQNTTLQDLIQNIKYGGAYDKLKMFLDNESKIKIQENISTLAKAAVEAGSKDILATLLEHGLKVTDALEIVVTSGKAELMDLVLGKVTDKKTEKYIVNEGLYFAVKANRKDIITYLVTRGANINTNQREKNTPLHTAIIEKCEVDLVEHLIKNGVNTKIPNKKTKTALDLVNIFLSNIQIDSKEKERFEKIKKLLIDKDYECLKGGPSVLSGFSYQIKYLTLYAIINTKLAISHNYQYELSTEAKNLVPFDDIHLRKTQGGRTRCEFVQVKHGKVEQCKFFSMLKNDNNMKEYIKGNDSIVKMFIKYNKILDSPAYKNTSTEFIYCMNSKFQNNFIPCFQYIGMADDDLLCGVKREHWIVEPKYLFIEIKYVMLNLIATSLYLTIMTDEFKNALNEQIKILENLITEEIIKIDDKHLWSMKTIADKGLIGMRDNLARFEIINGSTNDNKTVEIKLSEGCKLKATKGRLKKESAVETKELDESYCDKDIFLFFSKHNESEIKIKIDNFVKHFHVFTNCPSSAELDKIIEQEIKEEFKVDIPKLITTFCLQSVNEWITNFNKGKLQLFEDSNGKKLFNNIRLQIFNAFNKTYIDDLQRGNIRFEQCNEGVKDFLNSQNKLFHIITHNTRLHTIHIMQTLKTLKNLDEHNIYYANLGHILKSVENYKNFFDGFSSNDSNDVLVLECAHYAEQFQYIYFVLNCLKNMLTRNTRKKLIIIADNEDKIISEIKCMSNDHISYQCTLEFKVLTKDSQEYILNKNVSFQNNPHSIKKPLKISDFITISSACEVIDENVLSSILTNIEDIRIGNEKAFISYEYNSELYIPRHMISGNVNCPDIYKLPQNIEDQIIVVANNAGEGKSTMLTHLAHYIRTESGNSWIIRVDLRHYTDIKLLDGLNSITYGVDDTTKAVEQITRMVIDTNSADMNNTLERIILREIFNKYNRIRVILLIDGFDEISPGYKEKTCIMLKALAKSNVKQLWITTRFHLKEYLEKQLQVTAYTLITLTKKEQIQFLCKFWKFHLKNNKYMQETTEEEYNLGTLEKQRILMHNFKYITEHNSFNNTDKNFQWNLLSIQNFIDDEMKLQILAEGSLSLWEMPMNNKDFLKIPLHLEMLAKNLMQREWQIGVFQTLQYFDIYTDFIENKLEIYYERSTTRSGNQHAIDQADFTSVLFRKMHREIAVRTLFEHLLSSTIRVALPDLNVCSEHSNYLEKLIRAGLVKSNGNSVEFVHRTFAEYFFSEYFVTHLEHPGVQSTFLKNVLLDDDFHLVRQFIDRFLFQRQLVLQPVDHEGEQIESQHLYENILVQNVTKAMVNWTKNNVNILSLAVGEGHVEIFFLIFKNISKKAFVKLIMNKNSYNQGYTILQVCIFGNNLEMFIAIVDSIKELKMPIEKLLQTLIKRPFYNFITSASSRLVNYSTQRSVLRYKLMECDSSGQTVLHTSVEKKHFSISEKIINLAKSFSFLEELITKIDERGRNALHYAAQGNNCDILHIILKSIEENSRLCKDLLSQTDEEGETALHIAISYDCLEVCQLILKTAEKYDHVFKDMMMKHNVRGQTTLHAAVCVPRNKICHLLMMTLDNHEYLHRYLLTQSDKYSRTALHLAANYKQAEICDLILNSAINCPELLNHVIMLRDKWGDTVLQKTIATNDYIICSIILKYSVNNVDMFRELVTQCGFGMTALDIAAKMGHREICCVILHYAKVHRNVLKCLITQHIIRGFRKFVMNHNHKIYKVKYSDYGSCVSVLAKYKDCRDWGHVYMSSILRSHHALRIWLFRFRLRIKVISKSIRPKKYKYSKNRRCRILRIRFYNTVLCSRSRLYGCISKVNEFIKKINATSQAM